MGTAIQKFISFQKQKRKEKPRFLADNFNMPICIDEYMSSIPYNLQKPLVAYGHGVNMGLTVLLDAQTDDYALPSAFFYGFKVSQLFSIILNIRTVYGYYRSFRNSDSTMPYRNEWHHHRHEASFGSLLAAKLIFLSLVVMP